jgi:threonine dehydratase
MINHKEYPISFVEALKAKQVVYQHLKPTNLTYYASLSSLLDAAIYVKHENHNPTGSFKVRGGINLMHHLANDKIRGLNDY